MGKDELTLALLDGEYTALSPGSAVHQARNTWFLPHLSLDEVRTLERLYTRAGDSGAFPKLIAVHKPGSLDDIVPLTPGTPFPSTYVVELEPLRGFQPWTAVSSPPSLLAAKYIQALDSTRGRRVVPLYADWLKNLAWSPTDERMVFTNPHQWASFGKFLISPGEKVLSAAMYKMFAEVGERSFAYALEALDSSRSAEILLPSNDKVPTRSI